MICLLVGIIFRIKNAYDQVSSEYHAWRAIGFDVKCSNIELKAFLKLRIAMSSCVISVTLPMGYPRVPCFQSTVGLVNLHVSSGSYSRFSFNKLGLNNSMMTLMILGISCLCENGFPDLPWDGHKVVKASRYLKWMVRERWDDAFKTLNFLSPVPPLSISAIRLGFNKPCFLIIERIVVLDRNQVFL